MDLKKLAEPFPASDVEWRIAQAGKNAKGVWAKCLAYITNRAIMARLDEVCGPENWSNDFKDAPGGGILCGISIVIPVSGDDYPINVTKWDGADQTEIEAVKGGLSGAMKRAAVQWGIGRYLYNLPEGWAKVHDGGKHYGKAKDGTPFHWDPPPLPDWALPGGSGAPPVGPVQQPKGGNDKSAQDAFPDDLKPVPLTKAQMTKIKTLQREMNISDEQYHLRIRDLYGKTKTNELTKADASDLIDKLEQKRAEGLTS